MIPKKPPFRFKQFDVYHEQTAMKVGTDGVLLGAWTKVGEAERILDLGCGTGLLALMLAQKTKAAITALEINEKAIEEASHNISISPWSDQIEVVQADFRTYQSPINFDLIICNPPFFQGKEEDSSRNLARQNKHLPYSELIRKSAMLLDENGILSLIVPHQNGEEVLEMASLSNLHAAEIMHVKGHESAPYKRTLFRLLKSKQVPKVHREEITIEKARNVFTEEYVALLKPYLLHL